MRLLIVFYKNNIYQMNMQKNLIANIPQIRRPPDCYLTRITTLCKIAARKGLALAADFAACCLGHRRDDFAGHLFDLLVGEGFLTRQQGHFNGQ